MFAHLRWHLRCTSVAAMMLRSLAILGCTFGAGMLAMTCVRNDSVVVMPPVVVTPPAPVATEVPPPPSPPKPEPALHAMNPMIDTLCVIPGVAPDARCTWDDGFPALSPDGKTVAIAYHPDDGERGNPDLTIRFVDVASSKVVRDDLVLAPDEYDAQSAT